MLPVAPSNAARSRLMLIAAGLLLAVGAPWTPRAASADEAVTPWPKVFRDTTAVEVVNLDVFVRDADGRPVEGLQASDFVLKVDGEVVEVSHFYAVAGGRLPLEAVSEDGESGAEVELERRLLILYIDNANLSVSGRARAFEVLQQYLLDNWRDDLDVLVASSGGAQDNAALHVIQGLTDIPHEVSVALETLRDIAPGGQRFEVEERQLVRDLEALRVDTAAGFVDVKGDEDVDRQVAIRQATQQAQALLPRLQEHAQLRYDHVVQSLQALEQLIDLATGVPRRTSILYVGDRLDLRPGEGLLELYGERVASIADITNRLSVGMETGRFDGTAEYLELVRRANAGGVTFYGINASPSAALGLGGASAQRNAWSPRIANMVERSRRESQQILAEATGGKASRSAADVTSVLSSVMDDFDAYYALGFRPAEGQRTVGDVAVEVQRPAAGKLEVRARRSLQARDEGQTMGQRALAALLLDSVEDPMGIQLEALEPTPGEGNLLAVPLRLGIPLGELVLVPEGPEHLASVSLYVAARDAKGRTSRVLHHRCPIRIANSELLVALGRSAVCGLNLHMRPMAQSLAVVVHDEHAARTATARLQVDLSAASVPVEGPAAPAAPADPAVEGPR